MTGNPALDVQQFGQSLWYDNIRRRLLQDGTLRRLIEEDGVLGVTYNPPIFQKAIGLSDDYAQQIATMLDMDAATIYERLALDDIRAALDMLRPVYDRTGGRDGYVSLEVSPLLADDTATTVSEAKRLFAALGRPNAMIKIPATSAGIPAIEEAIAAGININVTLIFGMKQYEQVAQAYIRGLERFSAAGGDVSQVASVASFFLSRIDTLVDKMLDNNIRAAQGRDLARVAFNNKLKGKTAIANARLAYRRFRTLFYGERFAELRAQGAAVQRLLWASTGTKNPAYPDTLYVDSLIGRDTVNTVPPYTLAAFRDHGRAQPTLEDGFDEAEQQMALLGEVNIDPEQIAERLQGDGVESFVDSFRALLDQVDAKCAVLQTGVIRQQEVWIGSHGPAVEAALRDLEAQHLSARLWARDGTLWRDHPVISKAISRALGWLDPLAEIDFERLKRLQESMKAGIRDVVVLAMGGSGQPSDVVSGAFPQQPGFPRLRVLNTTDPDQIAALESSLDLERTLFVAASKSGTTFETRALLDYFYEKTGRRGAQFIAITTPGSPLEGLARERGFREVFPDSADTLGSYSALGYVGWVPAALAGRELRRLRAAFDRMLRACGVHVALKDDPGLSLGIVMGVIASRGQDKLSVFTSPSIAPFAEWIEHLIAESTGKEGRSLLPVTGAAVGSPHDYAPDRLIVYVRVDSDQNDELDGGVAALQQAGHPVVTLRIQDSYALMGEYLRWMLAAAVTARLMSVNPFDVSQINESRQQAERLMAGLEAGDGLPTGEPVLQSDGAAIYAPPPLVRVFREMSAHQGMDAERVQGLLAAQLNGTNAGDFIALLAYLPRSEAVHSALHEFRRRLRHATRRAITLSYGPEYLHNTGQLYKGSGRNGVFIILTADKAQPLPIPGRVRDFAGAEMAQALADYAVLQAHGYRVLRLHFSEVGQGLALLQSAADLVMERRV